MSQENIPHHENKAERKLDLQLIEPSNGPLSQVFSLVGQKDDQHDDTVNQKHVGPEENVFIWRIVQLVDQNQLKSEDWKHDIKLWWVFENSILENISKDDDLVEQNQLS